MCRDSGTMSAAPLSPRRGLNIGNSWYRVTPCRLHHLPVVCRPIGAYTPNSLILNPHIYHPQYDSGTMEN